jgi:DNA-directed RNA polymerase specialized sigma24 family protein
VNAVARDLTRHERVRSFWSLAREIARDWSHWSLDRDDLIQEAMVAAMLAIDRRGQEASPAYVAGKMRSHLSHVIRTAQRATRNREDADMATMPSHY